MAIKAISGLALVLSTTIGTQDIHKQSNVNPPIRAAETIQTEVRVIPPTPIPTSATTIQQENQNIAEAARTKKYTREEKVEILQNYLAKHNSPLINNAQDFIDASEQYNLDWRLVPAIAGVESSFGKNIVKNSYNPFGWGGGYYMFTSWREAIYTVSEGISENYIKQGRDTPEKMQPKYAPPSPKWSTKIHYFMNQIQEQPEKQNKNE